MSSFLRRIRLRSPIYLKPTGPYTLGPGQRLVMLLENPADSGTRLEFGTTWIEIPVEVNQ